MSEADPALVAFLGRVAAAHKGQLSEVEPSVWELMAPARQPDLFGKPVRRLTTDPEAHLLDPELDLLAEGTPLLQQLCRLVRGNEPVMFKGRYVPVWTPGAIETALADLWTKKTKPRLAQSERLALRASFRVRFRREFVSETILTVVVDDGGAWLSEVPISDEDALMPQPKLGLGWSALQERYRQALVCAEAGLFPAVLAHEAELAELLRKECDRITNYYDEVEESEEYAEGLNDVDAADAALAAVKADRAKLLAETRHRYKLHVQLQPISLALLTVTVTTVKAGASQIVFHPLVRDPLLPPCSGCERTATLMRLLPAPTCATCASLLD